MARKDALQRIYKQLVERRDALLRSLRGDLGDLSDVQDRQTGDSVDAAIDAAHAAVTSELAELESRELVQIERAIAQIRRGDYGKCEGCGRRIPVERLNILPYTTFCVQCQRDLEHSGFRSGRGFDESSKWEHVYDTESSDREERLRLQEIEIDLSRGAH